MRRARACVISSGRRRSSGTSAGVRSSSSGRGPSFAEYLVWKARYTGRLTALEQSFGGAMEAHAGRRRIRVRLGIGAAFAALLIVLAVVSQLWMRSRASEQRAVQQAHRAEAQQLFALGQVEDRPEPDTRVRIRHRSARAHRHGGDPAIRAPTALERTAGVRAAARAATAAYRALLSAPTANGWRTRDPMRACGGGMGRGH